VARLTELGRLLYDEIVVIASMRSMTVQTILLNRRVLEHERSPLVWVTLIAKLIVRIRSNHMLAEAAMRAVAIEALDFALVDRVMRLPCHLGSDILMAAIAELRFCHLQILLPFNVA
jgi:hypothetical protein